MADLSTDVVTNAVKAVSAAASSTTGTTESANTVSKLTFPLILQNLRNESNKQNYEFGRIIKASQPVDTKKEAKKLGLPENATLDEINKKYEEEIAKLKAELKEINDQEYE